MNKHLSAVILGAALAVPALALAAPGDDLADKFFSKNNPTLSAQEKAALSIAKKWNAGAGIQPLGGESFLNGEKIVRLRLISLHPPLAKAPVQPLRLVISNP